MKKILTLFVVISLFTFWNWVNRLNKIHSQQGLVFTVTHSTSGAQTNLFGNKHNRLLVWATSGTSGEIHEFNLDPDQKLLPGDKFTVSFNRVVLVSKKAIP